MRASSIAIVLFLGAAALSPSLRAEQGPSDQKMESDIDLLCRYLVDVYGDIDTVGHCKKWPQNLTNNPAHLHDAMKKVSPNEPSMAKRRQGDIETLSAQLGDLKTVKEARVLLRNWFKRKDSLYPPYLTPRSFDAWDPALSDPIVNQKVKAVQDSLCKTRDYLIAKAGDSETDPAVAEKSRKLQAHLEQFWFPRFQDGDKNFSCPGSDSKSTSNIQCQEGEVPFFNQNTGEWECITEAGDQATCSRCQ